MATKFALALTAAAVLGGCHTPYSPTPLATNFPTAKQEKLQAASHWTVIAGHMEQQLVEELKKLPQRPLFVVTPGNSTPFQQAVNSQLISSLVKDGYVVSRTPAGALQVSLDIQALTFTPDRKQAGTVGAATAIATGVWVLAERARVGDPIRKLGRFAGAVGIGAGIDAYEWYGSEYASGPTPRTEIIITASVTDEHRYLARASNTYYVADSDRALYGIQPPPQISQGFQVKGDR